MVKYEIKMNPAGQDTDKIKFADVIIKRWYGSEKYNLVNTAAPMFYYLDWIDFASGDYFIDINKKASDALKLEMERYTRKQRLHEAGIRKVFSVFNVYLHVFLSEKEEKPKKKVTRKKAKK